MTLTATATITLGKAPVTLTGLAVAALMAVAIATDLVGWPWPWLLAPLAPALAIAVFWLSFSAVLSVIFAEGLVAFMFGSLRNWASRT